MTAQSSPRRSLSFVTSQSLLAKGRSKKQVGCGTILTPFSIPGEPLGPLSRDPTKHLFTSVQEVRIGHRPKDSGS